MKKYGKHITEGRDRLARLAVFTTLLLAGCGISKVEAGEKIINGDARFDSESAKAIYDKLKFLPNTHFGYVPCLCGRKCETVCYKHLKEVGRI